MPNLKHSQNGYMLSKIYGEGLIIHSDLPYIILRPHNIYGPGMGLSHLIPEQMLITYKAKNKDKIQYIHQIIQEVFVILMMQ